MYNRRKSQRGQMVVVVALMLTTLVAMTGVVIDGGIALTNRRQVQNAADAGSLAGTRVLGLDLKWRSSPMTIPAPFANPDVAVCDAINEALTYNENAAQTLAQIDCHAPGLSADARYVFFDTAGIHDFSPQRLVGGGIPSNAQGVRVQATGTMNTVIMSVVGISTIDVGADAVALAGPAEPPIGLLMPFVIQNPLGPFIPGQQYESRSESEGECGFLLPTSTGVAAAPPERPSIVLTAASSSGGGNVILQAGGAPNVPVATPGGNTSFVASVTVTLSAGNGEKIHYTTNGSIPTAASPQYTSALTFSSTTLLKAIAVKSGVSSNVGTFLYTQVTPPAAPTANPGDGTLLPPNVNVTLSTATAGAVIWYTLDGSTPVAGGPSTPYSAPIPVATTTQIKAISAKSGATSSVATFNYTNSTTQPPVATPPDGTSFETSQVVVLSSPTSGAVIHYTLDGSTPTTSSLLYSGPIALTSTATIKAIATANSNNSIVATFNYTKTGPVCPDLTSGGFGWVDFNGGSSGNNDLKSWVGTPQTAPTDWFYTPCATPASYSCRDLHNVLDASDDHWRLLGTSGNRNISLRIACNKWVGKDTFVPIWDTYQTVTKNSNGHNAIFHLIGFATFRLDGIIDNKNNGSPSNDACGDGIAFGGTPNDKGFVGTYLDSFVGTKVAPCISAPPNPCAGLDSLGLAINLAK